MMRFGRWLAWAIVLALLPVENAAANAGPGYVPILAFGPILLILLLVLFSAVSGAYPILAHLDPGRNRWWRIALRWVGAIGIIVFAPFLSASNDIGPSLIGGLLLPAYLWLRRSIEMLWWAKAARSSDPKPAHLTTARPWRLNLAAGLLIVLPIWFFYSFAAPPGIPTPGAVLKEEHIRLLGRESPSRIQRVLVPQIIAHGPSAVAPLMAASNRALEGGSADEFFDEYVLAYSSFCLAKICDARAEEHLRALVRNHVFLAAPRANRWTADLWLWKRYAIAGYAECGRDRAVDDLIALFRRLETMKDTRRVAWLPLAALAKTGTRAGVTFALDHLPILIARAGQGGAGEDIQAASATVALLLRKGSHDELRQLPLYRRVFLFTNSPSGFQSEMNWIGDRPEPDTAAFAERWKSGEREIHAHWDQILRGPAEGPPRR